MTAANSQLASGDGIVVVDKPAGWTSHQVVGRCRRLLGTKKVGHAGTLDPMATGLLLIGVNRATRLLGHLAGKDKSYTATIRLGQATVTDDAEGDVVSDAGAGGVTAEAIAAALLNFTGVISQVPSSVSAIKVAGKRAYAVVRAGGEVELAAREVTVSRFEVLDVRAELGGAVEVLDVDVVVDCTSGTYIRALARDLGRVLGCGGHLTALRRTRVGTFGLDLVVLDAAGLADEQPPPLLGMAEVARRAFEVVEVDAAQAIEIGYGRSLDLALSADPTALVHDGQLLALYRPEAAARAIPLAVLS
ncbi:MAG: tRNA pseudouridine(55) synthase TruB [Propionicimonas sp.]